VAALLVTLLGGVASPANASTGSISGNVKGLGNANLASVPVTLHNVAGSPAGPGVLTDASGNYVLSGLAAGSYKLEFGLPAGSNYLTEWWNDKATFELADAIVVTVGAAVTGTNVVLAAGGTITGKVRGLNLLGLRDVSVSAAHSTGIFSNPVRTDGLGNFIITGLRTGSYTLFFGAASLNYVDEWWNDKATLATADYFTVTAGLTVSDRNVDLVAGSSSIEGNVKGVANSNLPSASVLVYTPAGELVTNTFTDASGNFVINGLAAGSYKLFLFAGGNYLGEWWNDKASRELADSIPVTTGGAVTGINAVLSAGGMITGNVKNSSSANISGVLVSAIDPDGNSVWQSLTDAGGNFTIARLPTGRYTLSFGDTTTFAGEWWNDKETRETADYFAVTAGLTASEKNASLAAWSTISGSLTDKLGAPIPGFAVVYLATDTAPSSNNLVQRFEVGIDGQYSIMLLRPGSYRVGFTDVSGGGVAPDGSLAASNPYVSEWWNNKYTFPTATSVVLPAGGQVVLNINGTLENPRFADVRDPLSTFYPFIEWMAANEISEGTAQPSGKPLYKPLDAVSRQAMALFMYRLSDEAFMPPESSTFADVPTTSQFYTAIEWMSARGISAGTAQLLGKPLFKPSDPVSRQAMAFFLARYACGNLAGLASPQRFADVPTTATSAAAINWMSLNNISTGTFQPGGLPLYKPADPVSRQAMAAFLFRVAPFRGFECSVL